MSQSMYDLCTWSPSASFDTYPNPEHPLAQRPHILRHWGLKGLKQQGVGTLRPHFGGTLDIEGKGPQFTHMGVVTVSIL